MNAVFRIFATALVVGTMQLPAIAPAFAPNPSSTPAQRRIEAAVTAYSDFYGITGGAVAVLIGDEVIYKRAFGDADVALGVPVTAETKFQLSSTTKIFSATLMSMLAREGLVEFDKPVSYYLPDLPKSWSDVLLEDIMSHVSGLPEVLECDESEDRDAALRCVFELERPASRREMFSYNQTNYMLAMMIVESVTGEPFPAALSHILFEPAGMSSAVLNGNYRDVVPGRSSSYYPDDAGGIELREYEFPWFLLSAAGLNASLDDMIAFSRAMNADLLLDAKWKARMWSAPTMMDGQAGGYALGWDLDELRNERLSAGHEGGMLTTFRVYPDAGLTAIVLTNGMHEYFGLDEFADVLAQSVDAEILTPLDSLAYRAKLRYMESGLDAAQALIASEACAATITSAQDCSDILGWLAEELINAGHSHDAEELVRRLDEGVERPETLSSQ